MAEASTLTLDVRPGESLRMTQSGACIEVQLVHKSGQLARLKVTAPREVRIEKHADPRAMREMMS